MNKFEGDTGVSSKVTHNVVAYTTSVISTPLRTEKENELHSLRTSTDLRVSTIKDDIKKIVKNMKSTEKSTFYSKKHNYPFLAGFKICDTCETFYNLVVKVLELIHFQTILEKLNDADMLPQASGFESKYKLEFFSLTSNNTNVTKFSALGISVNDSSKVIITVSYIVESLKIPDTIQAFLTSDVNIIKIIDKTFSYSLPEIENKNNEYKFSENVFNDSFTKLQASFPRNAEFSKESLVSYLQKYCSEKMIKSIKEESDQAKKEKEYEQYVLSKRASTEVQIDTRDFDFMYLNRYTLRSFFENYQKQENETGLFVDANFLFFRLKGFPLKKWLETYLMKNDQVIKDRFKESLTASGFGLECPAGGQPCEKLASYLIVETLMDEDVFNAMLTLTTDFVKIGNKENGIHNQEFLRRKAKDDYEKIDSEIENESDTNKRNKLIMKKRVLQYLYYYTPWWGGSVLFKTDDCGMGFSVDRERLADPFIAKSFELQKHCLIALIEQIINEGYFINETISHIVTYFKHTSRGVSDSDPLRLHEMKGKVQPVPLTYANATPEQNKSETYFVKGSTQINPKFLLSDLEKEYVPSLNPLKAKHLKKLFNSLKSENKGKQQLLFTVYKTALEINEIEIRQKQSKEKQNNMKSFPQISSGPIKKVIIDLLDGYELKLSVTSSSLEDVEREFRKELNLETVSHDGKLLELVGPEKYKLSSNLSTMLQRYITDTSVLQDVIKKVKCDSSDDGSKLQQQCIECSKIYNGPTENREFFCNALKAYLEKNPELDYTKDVDVDQLVNSLVSSNVKEDDKFEPFSNYYRDFNEKSIDNFDSAVQTQLSNSTNTVKMIPLLQYLKNLTGGKCKYVMLCLIRPEIKAQYCEGARKGLQFAQAVASTSSKDKNGSAENDNTGSGGRKKSKRLIKRGDDKNKTRKQYKYL